MKTTRLLLWLWATRMCIAVEQQVTCKSIFWDWVKCHDNNLGTLHPNQYPLNLTVLTYLDLDNNGLTTLGDKVFRNVTSLTALILSNNMLEVLHHDLFSSLYKLQILNLSNNRLMSLTDKRLFEFQGKLRKLVLSHNKLTVIYAEVLAPLHRLQVLKLTDNPFVCNCRLRFTMKWCDLRELDTNATCNVPFLYSGLSWTVLKPTESCDDIQMLEAISKSEEKTLPEMREKRVEITLLIVGISLALILIWCSVIGFYLWQKLANGCRKEKKNVIYDEAKPNEYYYYEYAKSPTENKKKVIFT
jgi:hypothetical protein